jgi:5'-nucleotidase
MTDTATVVLTDAQITRVREIVARFQEVHGRPPTVNFDADGVIYFFESAYLAHHNRQYPHHEPLTGPFERFDVGYNQTPEVAAALQLSMASLDWTTLPVDPRAQQVIALLLELGVDVAIVTSHRVDNLYSPSAKVYQFHEDFDGALDDRLLIGLDKTRVFGDLLVDDKPEVIGKVTPTWRHVYFTQRYNAELDGPRADWDTMLDVIAEQLEALVPDASAEDATDAEEPAVGAFLAPVAPTSATSVLDSLDWLPEPTRSPDTGLSWAAGEDGGERK